MNVLWAAPRPRTRHRRRPVLPNRRGRTEIASTSCSSARSGAPNPTEWSSRVDELTGGCTREGRTALPRGLAHRSAAALEATADVCAQLLAAGAVPVIAAEQWDDVHARCPRARRRRRAVRGRRRREHLELVIVLGGDGTILRAAELDARGTRRRCSA